MPLLYKYLPPQRATFFDDGLLRMTQPGDLNDPLECLSFHVLFDDSATYVSHASKIDCYTSLIKHLNNYLGIISFSRQSTSSTMWAHYSGNHAGFCVGLEQTPLALPQNPQDITFGTYYDVEYRDERYPLQMNDASITVVSRCLFLKAREWAYENEVRVLHALESANTHVETAAGQEFTIYLKNFPPSSVKEVLIGYKATQELETKVLAYAGAHQIPAYRMELSLSSSFMLERKRLL